MTWASFTSSFHKQQMWWGGGWVRYLTQQKMGQENQWFPSLSSRWFPNGQCGILRMHGCRVCPGAESRWGAALERPRPEACICLKVIWRHLEKGFPEDDTRVDLVKTNAFSKAPLVSQKAWRLEADVHPDGGRPRGWDLGRRPLFQGPHVYGLPHSLSKWGPSRQDAAVLIPRAEEDSWSRTFFIQ